jgi:hypothetical protein
VLAATAAAGAGTTDRAVTSPGAVTAIARSSPTVAFASAPAAGDCDRVRIWSLATRGVIRLGARRPCGPVTSTGRGLAGLAVAGSRAVWITYVGGNIREWSLWTATPTAPTPKLVRFVARDVDDPPPIVVGDSDGGVIPWAVDESVTGLRTDGTRAFRTTLDEPVRLLAAGGHKFAALLADGRVQILSSEGGLVREYPYAPGDVQALRLGGVGVLVQLRSGEVELHTSAARRRVQLPPGARMLDFAEGVVLYAHGGELRGRKLATGKDVLLRTTGKPVRAALDPSGLAYVSGRQVRVVSASSVAAAFFAAG